MRSVDGDGKRDRIVMRLLVMPMTGEEGDQADLLQHVQVYGSGVRDQQEGKRQDSDLIHHCCCRLRCDSIITLNSYPLSVMLLLFVPTRG